MTNEDLVRLEWYHQFKKIIRGSEDYLIVGIDVAKEKHHAFFETATGKTFKRRLIFKNNLEGFEKLLAHTKAITTQNNIPKIVFGVEPTGNYHKPLGMHLIRCACNVVLVSGVAVKRNRELLNGRWDKNDTKCAANVADLISQGKCLFYESPSSEISELRDLLKLRQHIKKEYGRLRTRIRNNLLAKYFPEFDIYFGKNPSESLAIVKWCLDPRKIADMEFDRFFQIVTTKNRGLAQQKRLREIQKIAIASIGCPIGRFAEYEAKVLVDKLKHSAELIKEIDNHIEQLASDFVEYHHLMTIPGFGKYISALVLATIGNPFRFASRDQVVKMAGYDLNAKRSGKGSEKAVPVISKKGSGALRYGLFQAAVIASSRNAYFMKYFTQQLQGRQKERGIKIDGSVKSPTTALCCILQSIDVR